MIAIFYRGGMNDLVLKRDGYKKADVSPSQKKKSGSLNSEVNMQSQKGSTHEMRQLAQGKEVLIDSETDIAIAPKSKQCAAVPPDHVKREARTVYLNPKCYPL